MITEDSIPDGVRMLDRQTLDAVYSAAYEDLRRLARSIKQSGPACTITPSTLVHEAWLRLAKSPSLARFSEAQFKYLAANAMYEILVEAARRRSTQKRGGGKVFVIFDESLDVSESCSRDVLALHDALGELAHVNSRQAEVIKAQWFGGLAIAEIASLLGVAKATIERECRAAKAWLGTKIRPAG